MSLLLRLVALGVPTLLVGGAGGFYAFDGSLEGEVLATDCHGTPDPHDDARRSNVTARVDVLGLEETVTVPNNVCHTLDVGDRGVVHVQSRTVILYDADGACKWHSEHGLGCQDPPRQA